MDGNVCRVVCECGGLQGAFIASQLGINVQVEQSIGSRRQYQGWAARGGKKEEGGK